MTDADAGQGSPRDNVVFEAGLFGGVLGMPRTFILHASGAKLPTDLKGLTAIRYHDASDPAEVETITAKVRSAIDLQWQKKTIEGEWWQFSLTARYWSEAARERPSGIFYYFKAERPRDPNAPPIDGTGEILLETPDRASGYFMTRSDANAALNARTSGVYWRADAADSTVLDGDDNAARVELIAARIARWQALANN